MTEAKPDYSNRPANFSDTTEALQVEIAHLADEGAAGLQRAVKEHRLIADELDEIDGPLRAFVAPKEPNTRFLVSPGRVVSFRSEQSPTGKRDMDREGDVWAVFTSSICATRDPEVIGWCEAHAGDEELHQEWHHERGTRARDCGVDVGLCRDADWEATGEWAELKVLQTATSRRPQQLPSNYNVDRLFKHLTPGRTGTGESETVNNAVEASRNADRERTKGR